VDGILTRKTTWRVHERASSAFFIDAAAYYRAFYEAASRARRSILILGWQFDSDVRLLRGADVPRGADPRSFELLTVLDRVCRERPLLEVKMLAWDHSVFFAFEREVLQQVVFGMTTVNRFQFRVDGTVPLGGSHHQKLAIIDGQIAFMGSTDLCQDRWDTSAHVAGDSLRVSRRGEGYKPYHEVQAVFTGDPARSLVDLFADRWQHATGNVLAPRDLVSDTNRLFNRLPVTLPMPVADVAFSRTVPAATDREHVHEIRDLYMRAIESAQKMIYIETQYLTSCCVRDALVARMKDASKPKLDVVMVLPRKPEKLKEELTIARPQASMLRTIVAAAKDGGHRLGLYNVVTSNEEYVYIHSKLMIVDDVLLTMGSANLANRSMMVDSEINATWSASPGDRALRCAIRRMRVRLLLEHLGEAADVRVATARQGLVARLDRVCDERRGRLRRHDLRSEPESLLEKVVHDLACEYVDPEDGAAA
jgi:phosphatidylserine/phosphatidylglycerophosphate/cardiolipin synthase-like enzyme